MRVSRLILLAAFCVLLGMLGLVPGQVFGQPWLPVSAPATGTLTNIAACLNQLRSGANQSVNLQLAATVTLADRERHLLVVQDDSAAMAVYTPLTGMDWQPGQRVLLQGDGIFPYVQALPGFPGQPSRQGFLNSFEEASNNATFYLSRFRGYLHPPVTGPYTFWMAADDAGELFLSPDDSPQRKQKIAEVKVGSATLSREWSRFPAQQSQPVTLQAGETYYIEALHVQSYGSENLAVAWSAPGMERSVIEGRYLTPWAEPSTSVMPAAETRWPGNGLLGQWWTNCFMRDFNALEAPSNNLAMVQIHSLKISAAGDAGLPLPQQIDEAGNLSVAPDWQWVELEGTVDFAGGTEDHVQLQLQRNDSLLGVRILDGRGLPREELIHSRVRLRGVLEHAYGPAGDLVNSVLWVPDQREVNCLPSPAGQPKDVDRVSVCEITPTDPQMSWGRWVSVSGRITGGTTNGLVTITGADNYQGFSSADGTNWVSLGKSVEISLQDPILAGLALASRSDSGWIAASFGQLESWGTNWNDANIGKHGQPGSFSYLNGNLALRGTGRRIGTTSDQQYFLYQPVGDRTEICAQLTDVVQTDPRAQSGLMFRESLDSKSPFAAVVYTPSSGAVFQYRPVSGGESMGFEARPEYRQNRWLKLVKRKSSLLVQGGPGLDIGTDQPVEITGTVTWQDSTPILTHAFFQAVSKTAVPVPAATNEPAPAISIADFVAKSLHPPEPYLFRGLDVAKLSGIITFYGEVLGTNFLFVQDGNRGGIQLAWTDPTLRPGLAVGQLVDMNGYSMVRKFPVIFDPYSIEVTGNGTLPAPTPYSPDLVESGSGQALWVEATGVVRSQATNGFLTLMTKSGALTVWLATGRGITNPEYDDALVRLRGVLSLDPAHTARLLVPSAEFVEVLESAPADPFAIPGFSVAALAGLDVKPDRMRRMKLSGVVTCPLPGGIYVQDGTGGVYIQTGGAASVHPGDRIEAVGYPDNGSAVLGFSQASVRKVGTADLPKPVRIVADDLGSKKYAGQVVSLEAMLLDQRDTQEAQLLTLQSGTKIFEAARVTDGAGKLPPIPIGSRMGITGVYQIDQGVTHPGMSESELARSVTSIKIWLPAPDDLVLLARPPWWNLKRAAWVGAIFASSLLGMLVWVRTLRRGVVQKTRELQAAMARLEKETRTSAVLAERDRLAGEIHDSLEQGLAAIMLQLDAANKHADQSPDIRRFLHLARNMAEFSRAEVQHAVWDLQSPLLANAGLGTALKHVAGQISSGSPEVKVAIIGQVRPLPSSVEHHLLRIAQEAITNAFKHAQAGSIAVDLDYSGPDLKLTITDNGRGFVTGNVKQPGQNGHFGLHGIRVRAKKIGAQLDITSQPGTGTVVKVQMKSNGQPDGVTTGAPEIL